MPRWLKNTLKTIAVLAVIFVLAIVAITIYISSNKKSILANVTKVLNKNLHGGTLTVGSMEPTFLSGFPGISLSLKDVVLKDSLWKTHHHTLLEAKHLNVSVNTLALFTGTIQINKIGITRANIYLFTDSTGYSNTFVFKKADKPKVVSDKSSSSTEVKRIELSQVNFILDNQKGHKLFDFEVDDLKGKIDYPGDDWKANLDLNVLVKSLAFNSLRGSFIKNKLLQGKIAGSFSDKTGVITVSPNTLNIGGDPFIISASFSTIKNAGNFTINIVANHILWKHASALLAPNISSHLNMFDLKNPIATKAILMGSFNGGDLSVNVNCSVKNNTLTTPEGTVENCAFQGVYTNNYINGKGITDQNSAIKLYHLTGDYEQVPFTVDTGIISNLDKPIVAGTLKSNFAVSKLNHLLSETMDFTKGNANLNLKYEANIVDFKLVKPTISGVINIKNADFTYVQDKLNFKNTSLSLDFSGEDLLLKNIHLQSGKSIVSMEGSVKNFKNLYYSAPEKIVVNWQIRSPQMYLGEFLGFLNHTAVVKAKKKNNSSKFADQLNTVLEKGKAEMHLHIDKAYYFKFLATDVNADLLLSEGMIELKNVNAKNAGGSFSLNGRVIQNDNLNHFAINTNVNNVNISNFFYSFDNFGLEDFSYKNLRGFLSLHTNIAGNITDQGKLVSKSLSGTVNLNLKKGALVDFAPIINVGKFAFPLRNLNNIVFNNLDGKFDLKGDKITINPMMISSSVLNMNVAGVYSLSTGTNIALDVPLRNPKKDELLQDSQEKLDKRMKGIVLHILAADGENGKIKFRWNKNHE